MNILLAVPQKDNSIQELNFFLSQDNADLYIFPEGFLDSNGQQKALVIDNGKIVDKYTKCILTKGEKQKGKRNGEKIINYYDDRLSNLFSRLAE